MQKDESDITDMCPSPKVDTPEVYRDVTKDI